MPRAAEAQLHTVVDEALTVQPLPHAALAQDVGRALFQDPGALPVLHVVAVAALQDHRIDPLQVQQVGQQQARPARRR